MTFAFYKQNVNEAAAALNLYVLKSRWPCQWVWNQSSKWGQKLENFRWSKQESRQKKIANVNFLYDDIVHAIDPLKYFKGSMVHALKIQ